MDGLQSVEQLLCCFAGLLVTQSYSFEQLTERVVGAVQQPVARTPSNLISLATMIGFFWSGGSSRLCGRLEFSTSRSPFNVSVSG